MQLAEQTFEFTEDWFSNHIPAWSKIFKDLRPRRILEIGSYEGRATSYLISNMHRLWPIAYHLRRHLGRQRRSSVRTDGRGRTAV